MNRHPIFSLAVLTLTVFGLFSVSDAQRVKPRPKPINEIVTVRASAIGPKLSPDQKRRQDAFEKAWQTLNDNYFDKTFSGLDWAAIRREFQPRVTAAKTDLELHQLLQQMIDRLGKSHFAIIPPDYFETLQNAKLTARSREKWLAAGKAAGEMPAVDAVAEDDDDGEGDDNSRFGIGVELRLLDEKFVVSRVDQGSSAELAGIKPGFIIDKINGVSLSDMSARILTQYAAVRNIRRHLPTQIVAWFLNGESDTTVFLTCLDGADKPVEYKVPRQPLTGEMISLGERYPVQFLQFKSASLSDDVGYVKFNVFAMPVIDRFCDALTQLSSKKAIVVDLRGNVGGVVGTLVALTGMMTDKKMTIGRSLYRVGVEPLTADSKAKNFKGKLVFLVDNQSVSAAEFFAASMQDNQRALIVGERTAGEALPSVSTTLATGAVLVYPIADFRSPNGRALEGNGVTPDYTVALDRRSLLAGSDVQLDKALALIRDNVDFEPTPPPPAMKLDRLTKLGNTDAPPPPAPAPKTVPKTAADVDAPPPPIAKGGQGSGSGSGLSALPPPPKSVPLVKDEKSLAVIADFATAVGGVSEFKKVLSYEASGSGTIGIRGSETAIDFRSYRQTPDKFTLAMRSPAIGEVREIYNGKNSYLQTDYGIDQNLYPGIDTTRMELFTAVFSVLDPTFLLSAKFEGTFDMDGRKLNVLTGKTEKGFDVGMAFDSVTKMLVRFSPPGMSYTLGDYRKVDGIMLPFQVDLERVVLMRIDNITLNPKIDPANFEKKEKCFDKPLTPEQRTP